MKVIPFKKYPRRIYFDVFFVAIAAYLAFDFYSEDYGLIRFIIFLLFIYIVLFLGLLGVFFEIYVKNESLEIKYVYNHVLRFERYAFSDIIEIEIHNVTPTYRKIIYIVTQGKKKRPLFNLFTTTEMKFFYETMVAKNIPVKVFPVGEFDD